MSNICTARTHKTHKPCTREAVNGTTVCELHGGTAPQTVKKAEVDRASRELDAFIAPIPLDDPEARPDYALHLEFRRTVARIRWLERRIADTLGADDLEWGRTKEEQVNATEFAGTNTTYEARTPVLVDLLARERVHLLKVTDLLARNHFQAAELAMRERAADYMYDLAIGIAKALRRDPNNRHVRAALEDYFASLGAAELSPP